MDTAQHESSICRRSFLQMAAAGLAGAALSAHRLAAADKPDAGSADPYKGFKMGLQLYTLRHYSVEQEMALARKLGLRYAEPFPGTMAASNDPATLNRYKKLIADNGLKLTAFGVVPFGRDAGKNRQLFEFAKALDIPTLTADPGPESLASLDKLVEEYGINVAIHNHGPGARYASIESVLAVMKDHHRRIGACVDTGHYLRSDVDPLEAVRKFGERTYEVHVKDVTASHAFTEVGKGRLDVPGLIAALRKAHFDGGFALEYEEHDQDPLPYVEECLVAVRRAFQQA